MAARLDVAAGLSYIVLWGAVVAHLAWPAGLLRWAGELLLGGLIVLSLFRASRHIRLLALVLFGTIAWLAWRAGDWSVVDRGLGSALPVAAFLPAIVLLRGAVEASPAIPAIRTRVSSMPEPEQRAWMTGGAHLVGAILTLGYVSVLRPLLPDEIESGRAMRLAACGTRGLGLAIVWSPFFVASAVASQLVPGVAAWHLVAGGAVLALLGGLLAHLVFNRGLGLFALARALSRLAPMLVPVAVAVGAVVATGVMTGWNVLQSVIVVIPLLAIGYLVLRSPAQLGSVVRRVVGGTSRMGDELLILSASTIFGAVIAGAAPPALIAVLDALLPTAAWPLILAEVSLIAGLGLLGLHPMVTAAVLIPYTLSAGLPVGGLALAQVVVLGWAASSTIAPWTLPVVVTAHAFAVPVRRLVLGENLAFVALLILAGSGFVAVVNALTNP